MIIEVPLESVPHEMRNGCWATFFYKSFTDAAFTDADTKHGLCRDGADFWCKYKSKAAIGLFLPELIIYYLL